MTRIPMIKDIHTAIEVYYRSSQIGNKELQELFGGMSSATMVRLKKLVLDRMNEKGVMQYSPHTVNTNIAFEVFGLDIADLEKRYKKLVQYGMIK